MNPLKMKSLSALISSSGKQAIAKAMNVLPAIALIALAAGAGLVGGPAGTARAATFDVTRCSSRWPTTAARL